ncbi:hypothetical protein M406DRAFT_247767 [Cryphonectria parasitica EP155]|uniref:DUF2828 domain-containing protein n=1 Tax=Cryphonectria parasitica (strain ATCC 38755 / EP155) TaxID=660469 RepID=A0A9P4YA85_CRYP1|nr:uncharacterized protein M406DRAFT_247767 [Cryphonectria parasitica EP155]KAF3769792.1 hypothetical protein M406DRAFT_247767 [Cryphonectria parasitica EP155]
MPPDPWFLRSTHPVFLPAHSALVLPEDEFEIFLQKDLKSMEGTSESNEAYQLSEKTESSEDSEAVVVSDVSTTADVREILDDINIDVDDSDSKDDAPSDMQNKMLTENADIAYRSTTEPLVDLFTELEDVVSGPRLLELLERAWRVDPVVTLKIIFNSRSIHLGKASRHTFYRCAGWLAKKHPRTLITNLPWLNRPLIQKKAEKKDDKRKTDDDYDDELVIVEEDLDDNDPARFDVKNGVAHGYWKDLLNILALHVNDKLDVLSNPRDILNIEREEDKRLWPKTQDDANIIRHEKRNARHDAAIKHFNNDSIYRALHLAVARLFATQLKADLNLLKGDDARARRNISLCGKWAPSLERFHDKHTSVATSIAEILHPLPEFTGFDTYDPENIDQRTLYLRHAREAYRKDLAALRKHLGCVERDITANTYKNIKYERVPSIAMNNYAALFARKDTDRFEQYVDQVATGKARISGATLLPSTLVKMVRESLRTRKRSFSQLAGDRKHKGAKDLVQAKMDEITAKSLDGQWNTLVQRTKDSGTLQNCIAVADVSGSMESPAFPDRTCPMDSAIGLSLLIAEVCKPPFGGAFITFSTNPKVEEVDLAQTFQDKYLQLKRAEWGMSTDFEAVFEKLILPMAIRDKLKPEDMVKRIFVFSDMHFNNAVDRTASPWATSYERIEKRFRDAGYDMPELVFWNLAGGRAGYMGGHWGSQGDPTAPKPVTAEQTGTALVSGYSQGMLKVFLDNGTFEDEEEEEEIVEKIGDDGEVIIDKAKKRKLDPMSVLNKAVRHKAYSMLRVVD